MPAGSLACNGDFSLLRLSARSYIEKNWYGDRSLENIAKNMQEVYKKDSRTIRGNLAKLTTICHILVKAIASLSLAVLSL